MATKVSAVQGTDPATACIKRIWKPVAMWRLRRGGERERGPMRVLRDCLAVMQSERGSGRGRNLSVVAITTHGLSSGEDDKDDVPMFCTRLIGRVGVRRSPWALCGDTTQLTMGD